MKMITCSIFSLKHLEYLFRINIVLFQRSQIARNDVSNIYNAITISFLRSTCLILIFNISVQSCLSCASTLIYVAGARTDKG